MCQYCDLIKAIDRYIQKADDDLEDALDKEGFADPKRTAKEINSIEDQVSEILDNQTSVFIDALKKAADNGLDLQAFFADVWPELMASDITGEELLKLFSKEFTETIPTITTNYLMEMDSELVADQITKRTTAWIDSWSKELADLMKLNTHEELGKVLKDSIAEGKGIEELTRDIMEKGIRNTRYKARRVAITETLRAHSYAKEESIRQNPAATGKEWVHTGAYRNEPRQNHVDMNGQVVGKTEPFELMGKDGTIYYPMVPRDSSLPASESVNCHCIHRAVIDDDILGLPLEERKRLQAEIIAEDDKAWEAENSAEAESE